VEGDRQWRVAGSGGQEVVEGESGECPGCTASCT